MARVERGRSPDPDRRSSSPRAPRSISPEVICHGCSRPGYMVAQCPDKRVRFNDSKNVQGPSTSPPQPVPSVEGVSYTEELQDCPFAKTAPPVEALMSETAVSEGSQMDLQSVSGSNVSVRRDIPATPILVCNVLDPSEADCNGVGCPQEASPKLLDSQRKHSQESTPAYTVPVRVGNIYVRAVVDTAAEVTIISTYIWDMIVPKPKVIGKKGTSNGREGIIELRLC